MLRKQAFEWIYLAQDRYQWWVVVSMLMNLLVLIKTGKLFD
jgi:hypothetical protein